MPCLSRNAIVAAVFEAVRFGVPGWEPGSFTNAISTGKEPGSGTGHPKSNSLFVVIIVVVIYAGPDQAQTAAILRLRWDLPMLWPHKVTRSLLRATKHDRCGTASIVATSSHRNACKHMRFVQIG